MISFADAASALAIGLLCGAVVAATSPHADDDL